MKRLRIQGKGYFIVAVDEKDMNAVERAAIARYVSDYIIDTFLVEEALSCSE